MKIFLVLALLVAPLAYANRCYLESTPGERIQCEIKSTQDDLMRLSTRVVELEAEVEILKTQILGKKSKR